MPSHTPRRPRFVPRLDSLEDRCTPAQFGVPWGDPTHLTASFAPDGTAAAGNTSSGLFAKMDAVAPRSAWQNAVLRAVQTWSELANVNVGLVADAGAALGAAGPTQGDARFGDIRFAGLPLDPSVMAEAVPPDPFVSGTLAGDVFFNTAAKFTTDSLYAVALHEVGHALGLAPSTDPNSVMFADLNTKAVLSGSDVAAIRALYGARAADANDLDKENSTLKEATRLRYPHLDTAAEDGSLPLVGYGDITTRGDVDTFWVKPLPGYRGPVTVRVQTGGVSLLDAKVTLLDTAGRAVATGVASGTGNGFVALTFKSVIPGEKYYIRVEAAPGSAFAVGRFAVGVTLDRLAKPTATPLEKVLTGPYDSLSYEDQYALFTNPNGAVFADDLHTDDTAAAANALPTVPGYAANTRYQTIASLADAADVDVYRVTAPRSTSVVLTASVRAVSPNGLPPRVEVLDANLNRVPVTVLANGNGTFTVQAAGLPGNRASYDVRVFAPNGSAGNYALDVQFGTTPAASREFAAGTFAAPGDQLGATLYVAQTQLFGLTLSATGSGGAVRMTITNAAGAVVYQLLASAGETVSGVGVLLPPGEYRVTFTAVAGAGGAGPASFSLRGATLSDPVGPVAGDPTLAPQYKAPAPGPTPAPPQYLYPTGTLTTDPFLWTFVFRS